MFVAAIDHSTPLVVRLHSAPSLIRNVFYDVDYLIAIGHVGSLDKCL